MQNNGRGSSQKRAEWGIRFYEIDQIIQIFHEIPKKFSGFLRK